MSPHPARATTAGRGAWWRWIFGCGLLALLIGLIGPDRVVATVTRLSPAWAGLLSALALTWLLLGALNIWLLLRRLTPASISDVVRAYVTSWTFSLFVPGQLGDAGQVWLLRKAGIPVLLSGAAYLLDKGVSLGWLGVVSLYGLTVYGSPKLLAGLLGLAATVALVLVALVALAPSRIPHGGRLGRLLEFIGGIVKESRTLRGRPGALLGNLGITVLKWVVMAGLFLAAFRSMGEAVEFQAAATIPVVGSLVGYVPVTVAGAGTSELTAIVLFGRVGVDAPTVLSVYLLLRVMLALWALLLMWALNGTWPRRATR